MSHSYPSIVGPLSAKDWEGQSVFAFGNATVDKSIPAEKIHRMENPSQETLTELLGSFHIDTLRDGVIFVLPEKADTVDIACVLEIQKAILHAHYKFVWFPNNSHATQDLLGVREETVPDIVRTLNLLKNYPWLMSSPLVDKLSDARIGLPVMILMPGPSLKEVLPHLRKIREHCLIACVARTILDCMEAGVAPDIVIQLDTYQIQRHYYEQLPPMPETILMPISISPFYPYAHKFRGVVMMDSFNTELLPNRARLRESYVSTLTAGLGLAEALHAPEAFVVGANLSSGAAPSQHPYCDQTNDAYPMISQSHYHLLSARNGSLVKSREWYIATATEAQLFAEAIATTTGTKFYSTTDETLLSRQWFPYKSVEDIFDLPLIDRQHYLNTIDGVLAVREKIDITKTRMHLLKQLQETRQIKKVYSLRGEESVDTVLRTHRVTRAAEKMRDTLLGPEVDAIGVASRMCDKW